MSSDLAVNKTREQYVIAGASKPVVVTRDPGAKYKVNLDGSHVSEKADGKRTEVVDSLAKMHITTIPTLSSSSSSSLTTPAGARSESAGSSVIVHGMPKKIVTVDKTHSVSTQTLPRFSAASSSSSSSSSIASTKPAIPAAFSSLFYYKPFILVQSEDSGISVAQSGEDPKLQVEILDESVVYIKYYDNNYWIELEAPGTYTIVGNHQTRQVCVEPPETVKRTLEFPMKV